MNFIDLETLPLFDENICLSDNSEISMYSTYKLHNTDQEKDHFWEKKVSSSSQSKQSQFVQRMKVFFRVKISQ